MPTSASPMSRNVAGTIVSICLPASVGPSRRLRWRGFRGRGAHRLPSWPDGVNGALAGKHELRQRGIPVALVVAGVRAVDNEHRRGAELIGGDVDDVIAAFDPGMALPAFPAEEAVGADVRPGRRTPRRSRGPMG